MNYVFFHIATIGNYETVVSEIMNTVFTSGILEKIDKFNICVVGHGSVKEYKHNKIFTLKLNNNIDCFEFPKIFWHIFLVYWRSNKS